MSEQDCKCGCHEFKGVACDACCRNSFANFITAHGSGGLRPTYDVNKDMPEYAPIHQKSDIEILVDRIEVLEKHICFNKDNEHKLNEALSAIQREYKDEFEQIKDFSAKVQSRFEDVDNKLCNHLINSSLDGNKIGKLERWKEVAIEKNIQDVGWMRKLEKEIDEINNGLIKRIGVLGEALHEMSEENRRLKYKPYKCPVCEGKVLYGSCKSCNKGIVWG